MTDVLESQALYRFGSRNERPGLTGSAHYIEHMAFRATEEIGRSVRAEGETRGRE